VRDATARSGKVPIRLWCQTPPVPGAGGGMRDTPRFMGIFDLLHSISNWNFLDSEGGPPE
jgi:hypothetical protein